jgi:hypothetical protein
MAWSRLLIWLLPMATTAALAACGGTVPAAGPGGEPSDTETRPLETAEPPPATSDFSETGDFGETGGSATATTWAAPEPEAGPELRPPPIVLANKAGRQEAVQGSYCITKVSASGEGEGVCADSSFQPPEELSVVRPQAKIAIALTGATVDEAPEGCSPACPSTVTVYPLGCGPDRAVAGFALSGAKTAWTVDLEPGAYELAVFAYFKAEDGSTGDTSGVVGLLVDPNRESAIVPIDATLAVCPYSGQP